MKNLRIYNESFHKVFTGFEFIVCTNTKPPHKLIPYDWVPMGLEHHLFRNEVLPHKFPIRTRIFHIMTFMRFYKGRYTKYVWQQLYLQYFSNTWLLYYAYILYLKLLCLRRWNALGRRRRK